MQAFTIDPDSPISVKLQLKAQISYQILSGALKPGDQLPSLRDLAAGLGVNVNTVVRALQEVEAEGLIVSQQGRGVFVAEDAPSPWFAGAIRSLAAQAVQKAKDWGLEPLEVALAVLAHSRMARPPSAQQQRVLLVGGYRPLLRQVRAALEVALPIQVDIALVDDLPELPRAQEYRVAVTTPFHVREVAHYVPGVLATAPDPWASLLALEDDTPVAVVAQDWVHAARVRRAMESAGLDHVAVSLHQVVGQEVTPPLAGVLHVVAAGETGAAVRQAAAPGAMVVEEEESISQDLLTRLRSRLDSPTLPRRVVSPWF